MRKMLGPSWMPAPISPNAADCSSTVTLQALAAQHVSGREAANAAAGDEDGAMEGGHQGRAGLNW
jgi:hypothetical protein